MGTLEFNAAVYYRYTAINLDLLFSKSHLGSMSTEERKAVLDATYQAQGQGCAPGILGVAIGGDRGSAYYASKETLFRKMGDTNPNPELAALENQITEEANQLGIGPMGFGGKTTVLDTKITHLNRLPASYYVTVSYMCWAYRRRKLIWKDGQAVYQ